MSQRSTSTNATTASAISVTRATRNCQISVMAWSLPLLAATATEPALSRHGRPDPPLPRTEATEPGRARHRGSGRDG